MSRRLVLVVALVLSTAACQGPVPSRAPRAGESSAQDGVRQASLEWDRLFNAGQAADLAALYADDAVSMPPGSPTVVGREALQAEFERFFAGNVARHETMIDSIIEQEDLTIEVARYRLTSRPRAGGPEVVETGRHMETRRRVGGHWKIVLEIWNTDSPPPK